MMMNHKVLPLLLALALFSIGPARAVVLDTGNVNESAPPDNPG